MQKLELSQKVLIVSNQQTTGPLWVFTLQLQKLDVALEAVPANVFQRSSEEIPDLIVLDVSWPENLILDMIKKLRVETVVPIILLTPVGTEAFQLNAYLAGVDDVLTKPISPSLFNAKIKVWLRRAWTVSPDTLEPLSVSKMQLLPEMRSVNMPNGVIVRLTNLEFRLLYFLMSRAGRPVTAEHLIQHVWGYADGADSTILKNLVYRVRRKIEKDPAKPVYLQTAPGLGYQFATDSR
ncbi:MAG: response regulator transcription factor [Chloroflexota bacterium]